MNIVKVLVVALIVSTGACSQDVAPPQSSAPAVVQATPSPVPADQKDPTGMLTLSPGAIDLCTAVDGAIAMEVSWDATKANTDGIKIFLKDPSTGEEKLWLAAPARGHDKTGNWMRDGTVVRLVNDHTDAELAKITVTSIKCSQ
jgi:hypothetical protein